MNTTNTPAVVSALPIRRLREFYKRIPNSLALTFILLALPITAAILQAPTILFFVSCIPVFALMFVSLFKTFLAPTQALQAYSEYLDGVDKQVLLTVKDSDELTSNERAAIRHSLNKRYPGWSLV